MEGLIPGRESMVKGADVTFFIEDKSGEVRKFHKAYNLTKHNTRVKWRVTICKEFEDMKS
jgi:hypothetical protein